MAMQCPYCGATNREDATRCANCGATLSDHPGSTGDAAPTIIDVSAGDPRSVPVAELPDTSGPTRPGWAWPANAGTREWGAGGERVFIARRGGRGCLISAVVAALLLFCVCLALAQLIVGAAGFASINWL